TTDFAAELQRHRRRLAPSADRLRARLARLGPADAGSSAATRPAAPAATEPALELGWLLARAWPDRIAMARAGRPGSFLVANGHEVAVPEGDPLARAEFVVVVEADGRRPTATIRRAVALDRVTALAAADDHLDWHEHVAWDDRSTAVRAERQRRLGAIVVHRQPLADPAPAATAAALADGLARRGLAVLPWSDRAIEVRQRLAWLHEQAPDDWPAVDDDTILDLARGWIADAGGRTLDDLGRIDVAARLLDQLDWRQRADLDRLAPTALELPSGRHRRLDYSSGRPVWAVRLQDLLGVDVHPTIGPHAIPLTIELRSPADSRPRSPPIYPGSGGGPTPPFGPTSEAGIPSTGGRSDRGSRRRSAERAAVQRLDLERHGSSAPGPCHHGAVCEGTLR
ncbi:MAG: ATP-dependent helicase C-terminal domain-containing protein, partial [Actinomycetota bacterium]